MLSWRNICTAFFFLLLFNCNNKKNLVPLNKIKSELVQTQRDWDICLKIRQLKETLYELKTPIELDFYYKIDSDSTAYFTTNIEDNEIMIEDSWGLHEYKEDENRLILYNDYSNGMNCLCQYRNEIRSKFCIYWDDEKSIFMDYKNDLPDGRYVEFDKSKNILITGNTVSLFSDNPMEMTSDTFVAFNSETYTEAIFARDIGGRSFKNGKFVINENGVVRTEEYIMGKLVNK